MAEIIDDTESFTISLTAASGGTTSTSSTASPGSLEWIRDNYDTDKDRYISRSERSAADTDWRASRISTASYQAVLNAYTAHTKLPAHGTSVASGGTATCSPPTVSYPNKPDISISGNVATCKITVSTGDGSKINPRTSTIELWNGESWVPNAISQLNQSITYAQSVTLRWTLKKAATNIRCMAFIKNACGAESGWVNSANATYTTTTGNAKGKIVDLSKPLSAQHSSNVPISFVVMNTGSATGRFKVDLYQGTRRVSSVSEMTLLAGRKSPRKTITMKMPSSGVSVAYSLRCIRIT